MDRQPIEIIENVLSFMSIDDAAALCAASNIDSKLTKRTDPVIYLSTTFKSPRSLLAAMADEGCLISGSRALEFLIPGSIGDDSREVEKIWLRLSEFVDHPEI
jgi:hypothetical protein